LQVGDTGPVESARRSNSRVLGSPFSGLSGHFLFQDLKRRFGHLKLSQKAVCDPEENIQCWIFITIYKD
jgi:hypothetical protein